MEFGLNNETLKNELKSKINKCLKKSNFKNFSTTVTISNKKIVEGINEIYDKDPKININHLIDVPVYPTIQYASSIVDKEKKEHPLGYIIPHMIIEKSGVPIASYKTERDIEEYKKRDKIRIHSKLGEMVFEITFEEFLKKGLSKEDILNYLKDSGNIIGDNSKLITKGIEYHFSEDYIGSIHVLCLQIEPVLRRILKNNGIEPISITAVGLRGNMLKSLIDQSESLIGESFAEYLRIKLIENDMDNTKNNLSHGNLGFDEFNKILSLSLLYIILKLSSI